MSSPERIVVGAFEEWASEAEPRVRRSLTALFGPSVGAEAAAEAMSFAWEHWDRVAGKANPIGYVFGVGRNRGRRMVSRRRVFFPEVPEERLPLVEPGLPGAMAALSERQRLAVGLVHGYGWTLTEVADLLGVKKTTVQNHVDRGLSRLRSSLGVTG